MVYTKPHLTYEQQLAKLTGRGLTCNDESGATQLLRAVGYYRLSAYVYPFRVMLPEEQQKIQSPVHYRSELIADGTTFEHVAAVWRFDRKLRLLILDAVETIEIGLRTHIAHVLGRRDMFGHLRDSSLNSEACGDPAGSTGSTKFEEWSARYADLLQKAQVEDFVKHNLYKHGDRLPVWIAVEFLDFGSITRLYSLLDKQDQVAVARELGIKGGPLLGKWVRDINYVRNVAAHHGRIWNRVLTYNAGKFNPAQVAPSLRHAAALQPRDKLYVQLACMAYLVKHLDPSSNWNRSLRTLVKKFPDLDGISPEKNMGFPEGWQGLPLWNSTDVDYPEW